ncbi:MAG: GspH/FimT family pseudopilin [Mariprofundus sp.]|nr:GspH/FimT family pseudopilin [Mariprofundus sp.]
MAIKDKMRIMPNLIGSDQGKQAGVLPSSALLDRQRGFTLLEVIIVMAIMGIVAAIGIPSFSDWREKQAVRSAAQALLAQMKQARIMAVADNRSVSINFTSSSYTFDADTTNDNSCGLCKNELVPLSQFANNLTVSPTTRRTFSSRGTANSGRVTLTSGGSSKIITINVVGRAYLH